MHALIFLVCSATAFYAVLTGRLDSAFQLSGLALATFVLAGLKKR